METSIRQSAIDYLNTLIGQPLLYVLKSPDTELYDFGFGELVEVADRRGQRRKIGTHIIHALCRFKVIWRNGERRVDIYYEDTPPEEVYSKINHLVGVKVSRIGLSDKNDLWLDFGDYWMVFATFESGEESWRFFTASKSDPHLVASDNWLDFVD